MLDSTQGGTVDLSALSGYVVVYCYPMTGQPGVPLPEGWDDIPGARGCTPQNMCYRDHHAEFQALGAQVFGLSVQSTAYQQEMAQRLQLPFAVLSDHHLAFSPGFAFAFVSSGGHATHQAVDLDCQGRQRGGGQIPYLPQQQRRFMGVGLAWQTNVILGW